MSIWLFLLILSGVAAIVILVLWRFIKQKDGLIIAAYITGFAVALSLCVSVWQAISMHCEGIRISAERDQILYQVQNLTSSKDKVKINEWILSYNDWVNDVNSEKKAWGWFAWHEPFDMSKHTIIDLV